MAFGHSFTRFVCALLCLWFALDLHADAVLEVYQLNDHPAMDREEVMPLGASESVVTPQKPGHDVSHAHAMLRERLSRGLQLLGQGQSQGQSGAFELTGSGKVDIQLQPSSGTLVSKADFQIVFSDANTITDNCGNGMIEGGKQCDDGNNHDGDGCSAGCMVEAGFACSGSVKSASVCHPIDSVDKRFATLVEQEEEACQSSADPKSFLLTKAAGGKCESIPSSEGEITHVNSEGWLAPETGIGFLGQQLSPDFSVQVSGGANEQVRAFAVCQSQMATACLPGKSEKGFGRHCTSHTSHTCVEVCADASACDGTGHNGSLELRGYTGESSKVCVFRNCKVPSSWSTGGIHIQPGAWCLAVAEGAVAAEADSPANRAVRRTTVTRRLFAVERQADSPTLPEEASGDHANVIAEEAMRHSDAVVSKPPPVVKNAEKHLASRMREAPWLMAQKAVERSREEVKALRAKQQATENELTQVARELSSTAASEKTSKADMKLVLSRAQDSKLSARSQTRAAMNQLKEASSELDAKSAKEVSSKASSEVHQKRVMQKMQTATAATETSKQSVREAAHELQSKRNDELEFEKKMEAKIDDARASSVSTKEDVSSLQASIAKASDELRNKETAEVRWKKSTAFGKSTAAKAARARGKREKTLKKLKEVGLKKVEAQALAVVVKNGKASEATAKAHFAARKNTETNALHVLRAEAKEASQKARLAVKAAKEQARQEELKAKGEAARMEASFRAKRAAERQHKAELQARKTDKLKAETLRAKQAEKMMDIAKKEADAASDNLAKEKSEEVVFKKAMADAAKTQASDRMNAEAAIKHVQEKVQKASTKEKLAKRSVDVQVMAAKAAQTEAEQLGLRERAAALAAETKNKRASELKAKVGSSLSQQEELKAKTAEAQAERDAGSAAHQQKMLKAEHEHADKVVQKSEERVAKAQAEEKAALTEQQAASQESTQKASLVKTMQSDIGTEVEQTAARAQMHKEEMDALNARLSKLRNDASSQMSKMSGQTTEIKKLEDSIRKQEQRIASGAARIQSLKPADCTTAEWGPYGPCSTQCGPGKKRRTRATLVEARWGGKACPALTEQARCEERQCDEMCGDGRQQDGEECDDHNQENGDGCDSSCHLEKGWTCADASCDTCGNSERSGDEECDDGNTEQGDGCSSTCKLETGYVWSTEAKASVEQLTLQRKFRENFASASTRCAGKGFLITNPVNFEAKCVNLPDTFEAGVQNAFSIIANDGHELAMSSTTASHAQVQLGRPIEVSTVHGDTAVESVAKPYAVCKTNMAKFCTTGAHSKRTCITSEVAKCVEVVVEAKFCDNGSHGEMAKRKHSQGTGFQDVCIFKDCDVPQRWSRDDKAGWCINVAINDQSY